MTEQIAVKTAAEAAEAISNHVMRGEMTAKQQRQAAEIIERYFSAVLLPESLTAALAAEQEPGQRQQAV